MSHSLNTLPRDFCKEPEDTLIYFYSSNRSSAKNKVVFTSNLFCLLLQGTKEVYTANSRETINNREMLMLTCGSTLMSERLLDDNSYAAILVFFSNTFLSDFCAKHVPDLQPLSSGRTVLKIGRNAFLDHYCESLLLLRQENNNKMDTLKVQELLGYISTTYPGEFRQLVSQALAGNADIKLKQVVEANINKDLTIDELAFLCNMSVSTFKRHFSGLYHMPPHKYALQQKMKRARQLLLLNRRPTEIFTELGYENLPAFSSGFKKYFGITPGRFLEENERKEKVFDLLE